MKLPHSLLRILISFYPPFLFGRTVVRSISPDWREVVVVIKKSLWNKNYVGTIFGGTLYAAADPVFMTMLINILGIKDYIIWDKSAEIDFKKPGRSDITFRFRITDADLQHIKNGLKESHKIMPEFFVEGIDEQGEVVVAVKKRIYIRKKAAKDRI